MSAELYDPPNEVLDRLRQEATDELVYLIESYPACKGWVEQAAKHYVTKQARYTMACVDARLSKLLAHTDLT